MSSLPTITLIGIVWGLLSSGCSAAGPVRTVNWNCTFADPQCFMYQAVSDPAMGACTAYSFRKPTPGSSILFDYCYSGSLICAGGNPSISSLAVKAGFANSQKTLGMYAFFDPRGGAGVDHRTWSGRNDQEWSWVCPQAGTVFPDPFIITSLEFFACGVGQGGCDWSV